MKQNIKNTIQFSLQPPDPGATTPQATQRLAWAASTGWCDLDIPSARGVGQYPDDMSHWHQGGLFTDAMKAAADGAYTDWDTAVTSLGLNMLTADNDPASTSQRQQWCALNDSRVSTEMALYNSMATATNSFLLYHTWEMLPMDDTEREVYVSPPPGVDMLSLADPIRHIRTNMDDSIPHLIVEFGEPTLPIYGIFGMQLFVNRAGDIVGTALLTTRSVMVADALREW